MKLKLLFFTFILAVNTSCKNSNSKTEYNSLESFSKSVESKPEKDFFKNTKITDNSNIFKEFLISRNSIISKPGIRFKWSGLQKGGCDTPLGICIILGIADETFSKVLVSEFKKKLVIIPMEEENGLTSDGYLPIFSDVQIDSLTSNDLVLKYKQIKAGIYKANYDNKQKRYVGVAVDLK